MKKLLLGVLSVTSIYSLPHAQNDANVSYVPPSAQASGLLQVNVKSDIAINDKSATCPCIFYHDKRLRSCMKSLTQEQLKNSFKEMLPDLKHHYLKTCNWPEHNRLLRTFNDAEWQELWQKIPDDQKYLIPATKAEQQKLIDPIIERATFISQIADDRCLVTLFLLPLMPLFRHKSIPCTFDFHKKTLKGEFLSKKATFFRGLRTPHEKQ